jgi:acyl carrier protein
MPDRKPSAIHRKTAQFNNPEHILKEVQAKKQPSAAAEFVAPRTPVEIAVARMVGEVLNLERVGVHDGFFAIGGDSILGVQLLSRIRETFQVELPLNLLFADIFTVEAIAKRIAQAQLEQTDAAEVALLLQELDGLSDEEARALLSSEAEDA